MVGWLAWTIANAAPQDEVEEVVVYGDLFARWDNTRWLVQNELWLPLGISFTNDNNLGFRTNIFQIRAVISCDKDGQLSKNRWEVSCEIEDIGLLMTTERHYKRPRDLQVVQQVLDEVDARLTGMDVQMQVDPNGGVTNFDLEGADTSNARERAAQEALRQVISRAMSGFHLRIPDNAQRSGQWNESNSRLMDLPSLTASRGSTIMTHQVSPYQEFQLVQTVGRGTVTVAIPTVAAPPAFTSSSVVDNGDFGESLGGVGGDGADASGTEGGSEVTPVGDPYRAELGIDATYSLTANGVALFRKADGIMTERVWVVEGLPTASSAGGTRTAPFRNAGRIQLLGTDDKPDVGPSKQVAWPFTVMGDLDPWVSIEALPGGQ